MKEVVSYLFNVKKLLNTKGDGISRKGNIVVGARLKGNVRSNCKSDIL